MFKLNFLPSRILSTLDVCYNYVCVVKHGTEEKKKSEKHEEDRERERRELN